LRRCVIGLFSNFRKLSLYGTCRCSVSDFFKKNQSVPNLKLPPQRGASHWPQLI
jgi:hypothetical protein